MKTQFKGKKLLRVKKEPRRQPSSDKQNKAPKEQQPQPKSEAIPGFGDF